MSDLTMDQYRARLSEQAALWRADDGADVGRRTPKARWSARLSAACVVLDLDQDPTDPLHVRLLPRVRLHSAAIGQRDPGPALAELRDIERILIAATSCLVALGEPRVWLVDCPCAPCGGRGRMRSGQSCACCDGSGIVGPRSPQHEGAPCPT